MQVQDQAAGAGASLSHSSASSSSAVSSSASSSSSGAAAAPASAAVPGSADAAAAPSASPAASLGPEQTLATTEQVKTTAKPWAAAAQEAGLSSASGVLSPAKRYDDLHDTLLRFTRDALRKSVRFGQEGEDEDVGGSVSKRTQMKAQGPEVSAEQFDGQLELYTTVSRKEGEGRRGTKPYRTVPYRIVTYRTVPYRIECTAVVDHSHPHPLLVLGPCSSALFRNSLSPHRVAADAVPGRRLSALPQRGVEGSGHGLRQAPRCRVWEYVVLSAAHGCGGRVLGGPGKET